MNKFWVVFRKELIDTLRDRRTLLVMVLIPLLAFPLMMKIVTAVTSASVKKSMEKRLVVAYIESQANPLLGMLKGESLLDVKTDLNEEQIRKGIESGELDFGLVIGPEFDSELKADKPGTVQLYYKGSDEGEMAKKRIDSLLDKYEEQILTERFGRLELDRGIAEGLNVVKRDVATMKEKIGEKLGGLVPYLFIIFCFLGSMYPAIDLAAGEKERGTIETLLVSPVSRLTIVLGKFTVVVLAGLFSVILSFVGLFFSLKSMNEIPAEFIGAFIKSFDPMTLFSILMLLIPIAILFSSIMLSISIFAKSFKEAQNLIGPMNFIVIIPAFMGMLPGIKLDMVTAWIPILNVSLATKQLMMGTAPAGLLAIVYGSSVILAAIGLFFCTYWFNRESVLFRS